MILRFLHGWAGSAAVWDPVIALLPEFDCRADDRGYFGPARTEWEGDIAIGHSFGAMRALAAPQGLRALVSVAGFDCFTARPDFPATPVRVVDRMLTRFDESPHALVAEFRARVGATETPPLNDIPALRADLAALRDDDRREDCRVPVIAIQAADDPILPAALHPHLFAQAPQVHRMLVDHGGHVLPETAPQLCADAIRQAVTQWG